MPRALIGVLRMCVPHPPLPYSRGAIARGQLLSTPRPRPVTNRGAMGCCTSSPPAIAAVTIVVVPPWSFCRWPSFYSCHVAAIQLLLCYRAMHSADMRSTAALQQHVGCKPLQSTPARYQYRGYGDGMGFYTSSLATVTAVAAVALWLHPSCSNILATPFALLVH